MKPQQICLLISLLGICVSHPLGSNYFQINRRSQSLGSRPILGKSLQSEDPLAKASVPQSLDTQFFEVGIDEPKVVLTSLEDDINVPISSPSKPGSISQSSSSIVSREPVVRNDVQPTPAIIVIHLSETEEIPEISDQKFEQQKLEEKEENLIASVPHPTASSHFKISDIKYNTETAGTDSDGTLEMSPIHIPEMQTQFNSFSTDKLNTNNQATTFSDEEKKQNEKDSSSQLDLNKSDGMNHPFDIPREQNEATSDNKIQFQQFSAQGDDDTDMSFGQTPNIPLNAPQTTHMKEITETRARPSFPALLSTSNSHSTETEEPLNLNVQKEEAIESHRFGHQQQKENEREIEVRARPSFPASLPTSLLATSEMEQPVEPSKKILQNKETIVSSGFNLHTLEEVEQETETKKSSFPSSLPTSQLQTSKVKQPLEPTSIEVQNEDNVPSNELSMQPQRVDDATEMRPLDPTTTGVMNEDAEVSSKFSYQSQEVVETETKDEPTFPQSLSVSPFLTSEVKQTIEPIISKVQEEVIEDLPGLSLQSHKASDTVTEKKPRPSFPPSLPTSHFQISEVKQTLEPSNEGAKNEVVVASSDFGVQPQITNGHKTEMRVEPSLSQTSDKEPSLEPTKVEIPTKDLVISPDPSLQSQLIKEPLSVRTSFPPSLSSSNLPISGSPQPLKPSNEKSQQDEHLDIPDQKIITKKFYEEKIDSVSSLQPVELEPQSPGTISTPELKTTSAHEMVNPFSFFSIPQRFQNNLFRDVGYASPPVQNRPNVALIKSHRLGANEDGAYGFIFESEDGIYREEQGGLTQPSINAKSGTFSYIAPDGTIVETSYVADERGYRSQSSPLARIHDPNLPSGKYDRFRSAMTSQASDVKDSDAQESEVTRERRL